MKLIVFSLAFCLLTTAFATAQTSTAPIFDAPWRGFDTGIFPDSGFAPASFAVGDLDGDGDADILVGDSHFALAGVTVLKNNGDKTFAKFVYYPLEYGQSVGEVALADFDGDGDLDAFASIRGGNDDAAIVRIWRNNGDGTLAASISFPTGTAPADIVAADFTGDGKPDIATANYVANSVSLLKHNGQTGAPAAYLAPVNFPVSTTYLNQISAGDANGDGRPDLAVSGFNGSGVTLSVLVNEGSGNFAAPVNYPSAPGSSSFSYAVALRDLNNDGKAELLGGGMYSSGSSSYGALTVRRFGASGSFGDAEIYQFELSVPPPKEITTGDLNGDGAPDVLCAVPSGRTMEGFEVLLSNGAGGFKAPKYYEASQQTFDVAAFDADGDGDADVATLANSSAAVTIHENPGNGVFRVPARYDVSAFPDGMDSADIDHDGDIDLVVNGELNIASNAPLMKILKNNGDGTFAPAIDYTPPRNFGDMKLRDINGDGYVDMIFAPDGNYPNYHIGTALNNGDGTFAPTVVKELFACGGGTIDAYDLDGDGDRDIVFAEEESCQTIPARIFVLRNDGPQNFFIMPPLNPPGLPHGLALSDVTGDGRADIVTAVSGSMEVYPGSGNLTFGAPILSTSEPYKFTTADFNADGKLDLGMIMPSVGWTDSIATALGNGNGTFQTPRTQTGSSVLEASFRNASDLSAADFNGDGKKDLVTYNFASNDASLFINAGDGSLLPHQRYGIGSTPHLGAAADFNGDGKIDIAAAIGLQPLGLTSAIVVLKNTAGRQTTPRTKFDFDGDAKTDIAIYRPSAGEWWIDRSSNGIGYALQFGNSSDRIVPADFTGDGKTDIAFFRPSNGNWFVLRSEDNSFYSFPFGTNGDIPSPADFDGDGKADAAVFRSSDSTWYINKSSGGTIIQQFGQSGDTPVTADYDGDNKADIAIYRVSSGQWWIQRSTAGLIAFQFGNSTDKPGQGDYTGDGKADVAFFRPSTGEWFVLRSENQSYYSFPFGTNGDIPAPGDYDGDGKTDATIFRSSNSTWFVNKSTGGNLIQAFGQAGDKPVPNAFVP